MSQDCECRCECPTSLNLPITGIGLNVNASALQGLGIAPGPDNTHLVTRDGKLVWEAISTGGQPSGGLTANLDLFVATTGDDANDGFTPETAMATVHRAFRYLQTVRFNGYTATVHVANGKYAGEILEAAHIDGPVILDGESKEGTELNFYLYFSFGNYILQNFRVKEVGLYAVAVQQLAAVSMHNVDLYAGTRSGIVVGGLGYLKIESATVYGPAEYLLYIEFGGMLWLSGNLALYGTVSQAAVYVITSGTLNFGSASSITGSVIGKCFSVHSNGMISSNIGKPETLIPGTIAGTVDTQTGGVCYPA